MHLKLRFCHFGQIYFLMDFSDDNNRAQIYVRSRNVDHKHLCDFIWVGSKRDIRQ